MAATTHMFPRAAGRARHAPDRCSTGPAERRRRGPERVGRVGEERWPDGAQVWNWAETAVLLGYGPGAWYFV
ncbi:hypothetical protein [Kitasatospora xanthocidica]|uniref:hypothetical protein n=1 Tax=Kitasatospora xanthocidica TaxID=83382 RepID=UPI001678C211|nr:hypothetical protein [Kitasatospora xanthocidica]